MKRIGIFGTSGFAREVDDVACELGYTAVFIAMDSHERERWPYDDEIVLESDIERLTGISFAIGIGDIRIREAVAGRYGDRLSFPNLIHPSATFGRGQRERLSQCRGIVVCAGARFMNHVDIGDFSVVDLNATIGHDCVLGPFVHLAPAAVVSGCVRIGKRAWIGAGAVVNQGSAERPLLIGDDTVIGSGAVVLGDCEPASVYAGVPARKIR